MVINPLDTNNINPNSLDVTLGHWFYRVGIVEGVISYFGPKWYGDGKRVALPFGVGILGMTKEHVSVVPPYIGQLRAKSTKGRQFITVCKDAGYGDLQYNNHWTAEFSNQLLGTSYLTVGERFGQIIFMEVDMGDDLYQRYDGQYTTQEWPECMVPKANRQDVYPWEAFEDFVTARVPEVW